MKRLVVFGILFVLITSMTCNRHRMNRYINGKYGEKQGKGGCPTCPEY